MIERTRDIGLAQELLAVIDRATAQKSAERFADAGELARPLAELLALAEEIARPDAAEHA